MIIEWILSLVSGEGMFFCLFVSFLGTQVHLILQRYQHSKL